MLGGRHGIRLHLDSLTSSPLPAAGRVASFSRVEVAVQNTPYRLDGSTERPETLLLLFFLLETQDGICHNYLSGNADDQSHNLHWCHWIGIIWGGGLGQGFLVGEWFGNGFILGEWKRTKNGHFLLYTRELESGQVLRPSARLVHFRQEE